MITNLLKGIRAEAGLAEGTTQFDKRTEAAVRDAKPGISRAARSLDVETIHENLMRIYNRLRGNMALSMAQASAVIGIGRDMKTLMNIASRLSSTANLVMSEDTEHAGAIMDEACQFPAELAEEVRQAAGIQLGESKDYQKRMDLFTKKLEQAVRDLRTVVDLGHAETAFSDAEQIMGLAAMVAAYAIKAGAKQKPSARGASLINYFLKAGQ